MAEAIDERLKAIVGAGRVTKDPKKLEKYGKDQSFVRRTHVEPHNISDLFDEQGIGGKLEALSAMRLQSESPPNTRPTRKLGLWPLLHRRPPAAPMDSFPAWLLSRLGAGRLP